VPKTTVDSEQVRDESIVNADVSPAAAIDGTKIVSNFGAQTLTVDGSVLVADSITNRVGVGTSTPTAKLDVLGDVKITTNAGLFLGRFNDAQESSLVAGLTAGDGGASWFNIDDSQFKGWNGSATVILG
jgi:hypothetical protein